jgi:WD40 repeat protein
VNGGGVAAIDGGIISESNGEKRPVADLGGLEQAKIMKPPRLKWPVAYGLSCSPDGRLLACLGRNVVLIDIAARQRLWTSHPLSHPSYAAFSPCGETLAVKATSGRIVVVDLRSGEVLHDHTNQKEGEGSGICFSPDGSGLVDGSWDGVLTIRRARESAILGREHFPGEMITRVTHDQSRRTWLVEHSPTLRPGENMSPPDYLSLRQWPFSLETTRTFSFGMHIESSTLSPDGSRFCFIQKFDERRVHIAQTSDGRVLTSSIPLEAVGTGSELAWSGDGGHVATVSGRMFVLLRASDLAVVGRVPCRHPASMAFLPGGDEMVLGSWNTSTIVKLSNAM